MQSFICIRRGQNSRMRRQWSTSKLVLILDAVHWNPEAPPQTLPANERRAESSCRQLTLNAVKDEPTQEGASDRDMEREAMGGEDLFSKLSKVNEKPLHNLHATHHMPTNSGLALIFSLLRNHVFVGHIKRF